MIATSGFHPEDLATFDRLGITPELLRVAQVQRVTNDEARAAWGICYRSDHLEGIWYPSLDSERGTVRSGRVRRDHPECDRDGKPISKNVGQRWTPKFGQLAKVGSRPRKRSLACHGRDGVILLN